MSKKSQLKPLSIALGTAFAASMAASNVATAAEGANPFATNELSSGYMQVAAEGKCGEGKCGGKKADKKADKEGKCGEGKCGGDKKTTEGKAMEEGKCGEGKCGAKKKAVKKGTEGKCGEGKCGGKK